MREIYRIDTILSQLTVAYEDMEDFKSDLQRKVADGWSLASIARPNKNGDSVARYTKLVDIKT